VVVENALGSEEPEHATKRTEVRSNANNRSETSIRRLSPEHVSGEKELALYVPDTTALD
jgi:hypothetical protein